MKPADQNAVSNYIEEQYGASPEYLWRKYPSYAVFRRENNRKWFAVVMEVPRNKLGLTGKDMVGILNIKCDPRLSGALRENRSIFPAYHMNKSNWVTVLLDGSVSMEELMPLLDMSYSLADSRRHTGTAWQQIPENRTKHIEE